MRRIALLLSILCSGPVVAAPLGTEITYQGELVFQDEVANGDFDFEFLLFDAETGGVLIGTLQVEDVPVHQGLFSVLLDFGPGIFTGEQRWLQLGVRTGDSVGGYTGLLPRQLLTSAPEALRARTVAENAISSAEVADGSLGAADIDSTEVQRRLVGSCSASQAIQAVGADGAVTCVNVPIGDITAVVAGNGLTGGATSGDAEIAVDPDYAIRNNNSTAQSASWWINGTMRMGSETGTSQAATKSIIVREARSTVGDAGTIIARAGDMFLERDGTSGGLRVRTTNLSSRTISCTGITETGSVIGFADDFTSVITQTVFTDAQDVVSYDCHFGNIFGGGQHTQVKMSRESADSWWYGFLRSTFNQ